jgi:hypothetical protein
MFDSVHSHCFGKNVTIYFQRGQTPSFGSLSMAWSTKYLSMALIYQVSKHGLVYQVSLDSSYIETV